MKVKEVENGVVVVSLSGKFRLGDETTKFHGVVHENLNYKRIKFVIDLGDVERIDSVGIGTLVSGLVSARKAGGRLVLARITNVQSLIAMVGLLNWFEVYDTVEEAIKSFS
jgi:anti-anti-sigma factor